jgi:hypothetical protein
MPHNSAHNCIACAKVGIAKYGARGFSVWKAVASHELGSTGYVWACAEHIEAVEQRWQKEHGTSPKPRKEAIPAQPKEAAPVSKPPQGDLF